MRLDEIDNERYSKMQSVKQRFFALRNGMLADTLRRAGSPYRIIFGLNLPQLRDIATVFGNDIDLAEQLWANDSTRESRLLAPMLVDPNESNRDMILRWIENGCKTYEEADLLCHSLLRKVEWVNEIVEILAVDDNPMKRYLSLRLSFNNVSRNPDRALEMADRELEREDPVTRVIATQLREEALFVMQDENPDD